MKKITLKESELFNIIKEYSQNDLTFKSTLNKSVDINIYGLNFNDGLHRGEDYDISQRSFTIDWFMDLDVRSNGLNNLMPSITNVVGYIDIDLYDENGDIKGEKTLNFNFKEMGFELIANVDEATFHSLYVSEIDIMMNSKEVQVKFK